MPNLKISVEHNLNKDEAKERIMNLLANLKNEFKDKVSNVNEIWNEYNSEFSFRIMGLPVKGNLTVETETIVLDGKLPIAALPFKRNIESLIRNEAEKLLK
ncbi:MAG: polyhydroxyalkanoic acid system family protein [Bacteroidales bacterium]|nr:polyhydroxyalkanoic acid system family protein [Bacteroidales bacterium]MBN2758410.1 polyhydroxyalkanoic acid system family protein [Bacteroidales bacterium]